MDTICYGIYKIFSEIINICYVFMLYQCLNGQKVNAHSMFAKMFMNPCLPFQQVYKEQLGFCSIFFIFIQLIFLFTLNYDNQVHDLEMNTSKYWNENVTWHQEHQFPLSQTQFVPNLRIVLGIASNCLVWHNSVASPHCLHQTSQMSHSTTNN